MKDKKTNNLCKLSKKLNLTIDLDHNLITQLWNTKQENLTNSNLLLQMKMKKLNILSWEITIAIKLSIMWGNKKRN